PKCTRMTNTKNIIAILCSVNIGDKPTIKPNAIAKAICLMELSLFNACSSFANKVNMSPPVKMFKYYT
ncbi:hypothetical protein, partial [Vallitalea maricola]|uniref:hypothetical protein n=1 Tax=Vallitalea maricola TaxID=3074433 RepID=UPI0030D85BA7